MNIFLPQWEYIIVFSPLSTTRVLIRKSDYSEPHDRRLKAENELLQADQLLEVLDILPVLTGNACMGNVHLSCEEVMDTLVKSKLIWGILVCCNSRFTVHTLIQSTIFPTTGHTYHSFSVLNDLSEGWDSDSSKATLRASEASQSVRQLVGRSTSGTAIQHSQPVQDSSNKHW